MTDQGRLDEFFARVRQRHEDGAREYGDESYARPMHALVIEIMEELEDVAGWAFIGWERLRRLRDKAWEERL